MDKYGCSLLPEEETEAQKKEKIMLTAKFVFHDVGGSGVSDESGNNDSGKVVPSRTRLITGKDLEYKKIIIEADDAYSYHLNLLCPIIELISIPENKKVEVILLTVRNGFQDPEYYVSTNCEMYVMNEKGSTIDQCRAV